MVRGHGEGKEKSLEKGWPIMGPNVFSKSFTNGYLWSCPGFASANTRFRRYPGTLIFAPV